MADGISRHADYPRFELGPTLTSEQVDFYTRWGFLHFRHFIEPDQVSTLINASRAVEQQWLARKTTKVNGVPIRYGQDLDGNTIVQRFAFANLFDQRLAAFLDDPRFRLLFPLIGRTDARIGANEKDGMVINHYVNAPGSRFSRLGWHTDGLRDIFLGTRLQPLLNVGVHLNTLAHNAGGLRLLPGTHRQSTRQLLFRKPYFLDHRPDPAEVAIVAEAGDLTVHDGRLWHRVARSDISGEVSRRRVLYVPLISGPYAPKNENSPTPIYQRLAWLSR